MKTFLKASQSLRWSSRKKMLTRSHILTRNMSDLVLEYHSFSALYLLLVVLSLTTRLINLIFRHFSSLLQFLRCFSLLGEILRESLRNAQVVESSLNLFTTFTHNMVIPIVSIAILPNKIHINHKLFRFAIAVMTQFLFNCSQIHWLTDYVKIVHYIEFSWIYWLQEIVCSFQLTTMS